MEAARGTDVGISKCEVVPQKDGSTMLYGLLGAKNGIAMGVLPDLP